MQKTFINIHHAKTPFVPLVSSSILGSYDFIPFPYCLSPYFISN